MRANGPCLRLFGGRLPQPLQLFVPVSGTLYGLPDGDGSGALGGTGLLHPALQGLQLIPSSWATSVTVRPDERTSSIAYRWDSTVKGKTSPRS